MFSDKIRKKQSCKVLGMAILHSVTFIYLVWLLMFFWEVQEAV